MADTAEKSAELLARLERLPFSRWHRNFFILAFLGVMFDAADFALFGAALPPIAREFGLNPAQAGLLASQPLAQPDHYLIEPSREQLLINQLDSKSLNPAPHYKDMTGWNRKALRITLPPSPSPAQIEAAELLCALAAQQFVHTALPFAARATK